MSQVLNTITGIQTGLAQTGMYRLPMEHTCPIGLKLVTWSILNRTVIW